MGVTRDSVRIGNNFVFKTSHPQDTPRAEISRTIRAIVKGIPHALFIGVIEINGVDYIIEQKYNFAHAYKIYNCLKYNPAEYKRTSEFFYNLQDKIRNANVGSDYKLDNIAIVNNQFYLIDGNFYKLK